MASSKQNEELVRMSELSQQYRVEFHADSSQIQIPSKHQPILQAILKLGRRDFASYATEPQIISNEPWKTAAKQIAKVLIEKAARCAQRNESSWRFACEPLIFARFSGEVVCQICSKRIWRSDIEACCQSDSVTATDLQRRQHAREPCRCPRIARNQDLNEAVGLNRIFCHREDEEVRYEKDLTSHLKKDFQKPDAIYGLRKTRNIENLLYDTRKRKMDEMDDPRQLHEVLDPSPYEQALNGTGDALLFPFLVVEAKSGLSRNDWHSINIQTAFPIRTFLQIQARLIDTANHPYPNALDPLVWFFSHKGEDWRLSMAFCEKSEMQKNKFGTIIYHVVDVWRGSILTLNGALQLLLLVDYVFDWARDVYRPGIINHLRSLATGENDAASILYADTDIYSTRQEATDLRLNEDSERQRYLNLTLSQRSFANLDTSVCAVRHASFIETRYRCIYVTEDNYKSLFQSTTNSEAKAKSLKAAIIEQSVYPFLVLSKTLDSIERQWTGNSRLSYNDNARFYAIMSYATFLSPSWNIIREIYILAVAESKCEDIFGETDDDFFNAKSDDMPLHDDKLLSILDRLQAGAAVDDILMTAISRSCFLFGIRKQPNNAPIPDGSTQAQVELSTLSKTSDGALIGPGAIGSKDKRFKKDKWDSESIYDDSGSSTSSSSESSESDDDCICYCYDNSWEFFIPHDCPDIGGKALWYLRNIMHYIYEICRKGSNEPDEPFLRASKGLIRRYSREDSSQKPFLSTSGEILQWSEDGYVFVYAPSKIRDTDKSKSNICIYIIEHDILPPSESELREKARRAFETQDVYHTARESERMSFTAAVTTPGKVQWNIEYTYGIYFEGYEFYEFFCPNGSTTNCPTMQGSQRASEETGTYIWSRNLNPWPNPEISHNLIILYKVLFQEMWFWATVVDQKRSDGIDCCFVCAAPTRNRHIVMCGDCDEALNDPDEDPIYHTILRHIRGPSTSNYDVTQLYISLQTLPIPQDIAARPDRKQGLLLGHVALLEECEELRTPFLNLKDLMHQWWCFQYMSRRWAMWFGYCEPSTRVVPRRRIASSAI